MADQMIESARKQMPGIHIAHLADATCPKHPLADEVLRTPEGMEFGTMRMWHFSQLEGEWLSADVDLLFLKDVWHVFEDDFDMAASSRVGTKWERSKYSQVMPINNGILWSRSQAFWREQMTGYGRLAEGWKSWGEQMLFNNVFESGKFKTKLLPSTYNHPPEDGRTDFEGIHVLHFKGRRKSMMEGA